jgi:hypothetical protein
MRISRYRCCIALLLKITKSLLTKDDVVIKTKSPIDNKPR